MIHHFTCFSEDGTVKQRSRRGGRQRQLPVLMPATQSAPKVSINPSHPDLLEIPFLDKSPIWKRTRKRKRQLQITATARGEIRRMKRHQALTSRAVAPSASKGEPGKTVFFLTPDLTTPHKWHRTRVFRPCRSVPEARRTCFAHFVAESSENIPFSSLNNILDSW